MTARRARPVPRPAALAVLLALLAAPAAGQAPPEGLRCLELAVGEWSGGAGRGSDSLYLRPPPRVELLPRPAGEPGPALLVREVEGSVPGVHDYAEWRLSAERDTLFLGWSTGFSGFGGRLRRAGEAYRGTVTSFTDVVGVPPDTAELTAVPVDCRAPLPPEATGMRRIPRGVRLEGGDSVRLGMPLAAVEDVEPRPGYRMVRLRAPLAAPFAGATDVELLPDGRGALAILRFGLPPDADYVALVREISAEYGPPVDRGPHPPRATPGESATWANRESNFVLSRDLLPDGTARLYVLMSLHRQRR